jgi:hypothetical protein
MTTIPTPPRLPWKASHVSWGVLTAGPMFGWPGAFAAVSIGLLAGIYQLLVYRERRKILLDIYLNAPPSTEVILIGGTAEPTMRVVLGAGGRRPTTSMHKRGEARSPHHHSSRPGRP